MSGGQPPTQMVRVNLVMPDAMKDKIARLARERMCSEAAVMRQLLQTALDATTNPPPQVA